MFEGQAQFVDQNRQAMALHETGPVHVRSNDFGYGNVMLSGHFAFPFVSDIVLHPLRSFTLQSS